MAFLKATLVARIRRDLNSREWETTSTTVGTGATIAVPDGTLWVAGDVGEWQTGTVGGEQFLVQSVSINNLTTVRGHNGTTAEAHTSGDRVVKNPAFQYAQITDAVSAVVDELWPHIYKKVTATVTLLTTGEHHYSVAATFEDLSSVVQMSTGTPDQPRFYGGRRNPFTAELVRGLPDNFPGAEDTGKTVYLPQVYNTTNTVLVNGIARLTDTVTAGSYDDFSAGVEVSCIEYLAVADLVEGSDAARSTGQDVSMYDQSVPPGRRSGIADNVWRRKGMRARHQWEESLRLTLPRLRTYRTDRWSY